MFGFVAIVLDGKRTARKALDALEDITPELTWIDDVAVLSRSKLGAIHIHSTWAQDDADVAAGGAWGMVTGSLVGLLFGPGGAMAGAAIGGTVGMIGGASCEMEMDDPALDEIASALAKNTSALILVGAAPTLDNFVSGTESFGGMIIRSDLSEKDIKALRKDIRRAA